MTDDAMMAAALMSRPKVKDYRPGTPVSLVQWKLDGFRIALWKGRDGRCHATGRKADVDWGPELFRHRKILELVDGLPIMTGVDGELHLERGVPASEVRRAMCSDDLEQVERLQYSAFSVPIVGGDGVTPPCWTLGAANVWLVSQGFTLPPLHDMWDEPRPYSAAVVSDLKHKARQLGVEGFVLKAGHTHPWWKVKPVRTIDCVVYDRLPGIGKHHGRIGSLMIGLYDERGRLLPVGKVGTGLSDEQRELPWERWKGSVVEVEYDSIAGRGKLRMPVFLRARDDKPARECTREQLDVR